MTYAKALAEATTRLTTAGIAEAKNDAWLLLEYVAGIDRNFYFMHSSDEIDLVVRKKYWECIAKREKRVPLQHITGETVFMGLPFKVNENVLCPRQDTETLVEEALSKIKELSFEKNRISILDMCTGSGCIAISLCKLAGDYLKKNNSDVKTDFSAVDLSENALEIARENKKINDADIEFIKSDLFTCFDGKKDVFDVIVSNPPYINSDVIPTLMPEVKDHEPKLALDGGVDGLVFYRDIVANSIRCLKNGGWLLFEIGYDQGQSVSSMMKNAGFIDVIVIKDLSGNDRVVRGQKNV